MSVVRDYVSGLSESDRFRILADFEEFETVGSIGDVPLRQHAMTIIKSIDAGEYNIVMWMNLLAAECHRYYCYKYLNAQREWGRPTRQPKT